MSTAPENDYYNILHVKRGATAEEIRKAYKKRALESHPDRPGGNEHQFRAVNEAYEVLSNAEKRDIYDRLGKEGLSGGGAAGNPFAGMDPFQVFRQMFSDMDPQHQAPGVNTTTVRKVQRSHDIFFDLNITLCDIYRGCTKKLAVRRNRFCKLCTGRGVTSTDDIACIQCHGSGKQTIVQRTFMGERIQHVHCTFCQGHGIKAPISMPKCPTCNGKRTVSERSIFEVQVEPGTPEGWQIVCPGEGDDPLLAGETVGDVVLKVCTSATNGWSRSDQHLIYRLDATLADCVTGFSQTIEHPGRGPISFSIGQVIRPTLIDGDSLYAPWIIDDGGMPEWHQKPAGWLILLIRVQFPSVCVEPPETIRALFGSTSGSSTSGSSSTNSGETSDDTTDTSTRHELPRPPVEAEQAVMRQLFAPAQSQQSQQMPQFFMQQPGGGATFFQFSRN